MPINCNFCRSIKFRITLASIGVACGMIAGIWFAAIYHNFNAASFALISSIFAVLTLILHIKYKRTTLHRCAPYLRSLSVLGCMGQLLGFSAFVTYISLAIVLRQNLSQVYGENYWVALVWAWMTWKWGFGLFWYARKYKREFEQAEYQALTKDDELMKEDDSMQNPATAMASSDGELVE